MKNTHIVLTTDFSAESRRAYEPVSRLAASLSARITLLAVLPELTAIPYGAILAPAQPDPQMPERIASAEEQMKQEVETLASEAEVEGKVIVAESIEKAIADFAEEQGAAFIAMSTHGRTALRRLVMGSVTEAVLRHSVVPVIVFPRKS